MSCSDLVSVIIPTYNRACLLVDALDSVRNQTYRPIEAIVVDDGSTDNTQAVVKHFLEANSSEEFQILYLYQKNQGPSAARNMGIIAASGEYIQFLDSDDSIHPSKIELHVNELSKHPSIHCIFSNRKNFDSLPKWTEPPPLKAIKVRSENHYLSFDFLSNSGLYRKESCHLAGLWSEHLWLGEDLEFNLRILALNKWILYFDFCLSACRQHSGLRLTGSIESRDLRHRNLIFFNELAERANKVTNIDNPKLFDCLATLYTRLALDFMMGDDRAGALNTISSCKQMPLNQKRIRRLTILVFLAYLPSSWLRAIWKVGEYYRDIRSSILAKQCN